MPCSSNDLKKAKKEGKVCNSSTGNLVAKATAKSLVKTKGFKYDEDKAMVGPKKDFSKKKTKEKVCTVTCTTKKKSPKKKSTKKKSPKSSKNKRKSKKSKSPKRTSKERPKKSPKKSEDEGIELCFVKGKNICTDGFVCTDKGKCIKKTKTGRPYGEKKLREKYGDEYEYNEKSRVVGRRADVLKALAKIGLVPTSPESDSSDDEQEHKYDSPKKPPKKKSSRCDDKDDYLACGKNELCSSVSGKCIKDIKRNRTKKSILKTTDGRTIVGTADLLNKLQKIIGGKISDASAAESESEVSSEDEMPSASGPNKRYGESLSDTQQTILEKLEKIVNKCNKASDKEAVDICYKPLVKLYQSDEEELVDLLNALYKDNEISEKAKDLLEFKGYEKFLDYLKKHGYKSSKGLIGKTSQKLLTDSESESEEEKRISPYSKKTSQKLLTDSESESEEEKRISPYSNKKTSQKLLTDSETESESEEEKTEYEEPLPKPSPRKKLAPLRCDDRYNYLECDNGYVCNSGSGECIKDSLSTRENKTVLITDDGRTIIGEEKNIRALHKVLGGTIQEKESKATTPKKVGTSSAKITQAQKTIIDTFKKCIDKL